jgi:phosphatidylethanolamine-binding protein (PEBP) family uncharacterized protein
MRTGRNSFLQTAYLPPDPPTGHEPHLYAFQIFALDRKLDFAIDTRSQVSRRCNDRPRPGQGYPSWGL